MNNRLKNIERRKLESFFNENGYTPKIASSDDKLAQFFADCNIDIMQYRIVDEMWLSKARTMSNFWTQANDEDVLKVLNAINEKLIVEQETGTGYGENIDYSSEIEFLSSLIKSFKNAGVRISILQETITKERLMPHINTLMQSEDFLLALDKVHTLVVHLLKIKLASCSVIRKRHSLQHLFSLVIEHYSLTEVQKKKLTNDMNYSTIFNEARNNGSFAHDNERTLLTDIDAKILCETFISTINLLDSI